MEEGKPLATARLEQHAAYIFDLLPEINTVQGYLLYSFLAYLFILFMGWLANPTAERLKDDYINSTKDMN